jgi:hypothetical protein
MKNFYPLLILFIFPLLISSCSPGFTIYKKGVPYHFESKRKGLYKMFCASGDLKTILAGAEKIPQKTREKFFYFNCVQPDASRVQELFSGMSVEERKDLRASYRREGYTLSYFPCEY